MYMICMCKDMSRQLKAMLESLQQRQKKEVEAWDAAVAGEAGDGATAEDLDTAMEEEV